jgi:hypothetical protein
MTNKCVVFLTLAPYSRALRVTPLLSAGQGGPLGNTCVPYGQKENSKNIELLSRAMPQAKKRRDSEILGATLQSKKHRMRTRARSLRTSPSAAG